MYLVIFGTCIPQSANKMNINQLSAVSNCKIERLVGRLISVYSLNIALCHIYLERKKMDDGTSSLSKELARTIISL